jgi:hypothetical protein
MNQNEREQFCAFFRRNRYDIIQGRKHSDWGPTFTFSPRNVRAAQKAGQMMVKMYQGEPLQIRHARCARLRDKGRQSTTDVVVVTEFPERTQEVFGINDGIVLRVDIYLQDDALAALETEMVRLDMP